MPGVAFGCCSPPPRFPGSQKMSDLAAGGKGRRLVRLRTIRRWKAGFAPALFRYFDKAPLETVRKGRGEVGYGLEMPTNNYNHGQGEAVIPTTQPFQRVKYKPVLQLSQPGVTYGIKEENSSVIQEDT